MYTDLAKGFGVLGADQARVFYSHDVPPIFYIGSSQLRVFVFRRRTALSTQVESTRFSNEFYWPTEDYPRAAIGRGESFLVESVRPFCVASREGLGNGS